MDLEVLDFLGKEFCLNIYINYTLFFVRNTDEVNGTHPLMFYLRLYH